ncbi:Uncharacterised protein [Yersinia pseudotuberculosis]|nr:Uncharacterised protein [Yersinia pseudotuberculosis]
MEALDDFLKRYSIPTNHFTIESFKGFHETFKHNVQRDPRIFNSIPACIKVEAESVSCDLIPSGEVVRYEGTDSEGAFTKLGPFYLKIKR